MQTERNAEDDAFADGDALDAVARNKRRERRMSRGCNPNGMKSLGSLHKKYANGCLNVEAVVVVGGYR